MCSNLTITKPIDAVTLLLMLIKYLPATIEVIGP